MLDLEKLWIDGTAIKQISVIGLPKMKIVWGCDMEDRTVLTGVGVKRKSKW